MSKFVLTAQLQLQAPGNTRQVINQLRSQLQGQLNIPVSVTGSVQATKQISQVKKQAQEATTAADRMGKAFGASIKRFAAFNIATRAVGLLASKLSQAVDEAIAFQRQLIKISQVTGKTTDELSGLVQEITSLSTALGVSSTSLLNTTRILAQAGIQAGDLNVALEALAKTTLAPTFDNITETAEGAVAILAQFGQGVGALEQQLGAINAVAGQFAVESGDLISVVRRTGGVFKQAGGDLNELLALFTSVRATTRENAESIATGLRTIFTRIQRPQTIEYLKQFGVNLLDLEGKFVGPYKAVEQLNRALSGLEEGDIRFVEIAEELGGFRQIGKVIPLIQQFDLAERSRQAALEGGNSLNKDAAIAQQALAVQIEKTREKFLALIRSISETSTFRIMIQSLLGIAEAFIKVADAIKPILPLIATFAAFKLAKGIGGFASGIGAGLRGKNQGGKIHAFARGGTVPGTGNRDTVPAMLTPGEFVIRKSSVNKIGAGTLAAMNENKYGRGGPASFKSSKPFVNVSRTTLHKEPGHKFDTGKNRFNKEDSITFNKTNPKTIDVNNLVKLHGNSSLVQDYKNAPTAQMRGVAFEEIAKVELNLNKLAKGSSRIDASGPGGQIYEIKSEQRALTDAKIGEKMIGAALSPVSDIDEVVQKRLTKQGLSRKHEDVELGRIGVIQDVTQKGRFTSKATSKKDQEVGLGRLSGLFFGGAIRHYATAGKVLPLSPSELTRMKRLNAKGKKVTPEENKDRKTLETRFKSAGTAKEKTFDSGRSYGAVYLEKATSPKGGKSSITFPKSKGKEEVKVNYDLNHAFLDPVDGQKIKKDIVTPRAEKAVNETASYLAKIIGAKVTPTKNIPNFQAIVGSVFEKGVELNSNQNSSLDIDDGRTFDFAGGLGSASKIFGADGAKLRNVKTDAKVASTSSAVESVRKKVKTDLTESRGVLGFAKGGGVPSSSDTVPAMLTPGEFVINKKASQSIGYANLNRMNKQGVVGYASGGAVGGVQYFNEGGDVEAQQGSLGFETLALQLQNLNVGMQLLIQSTNLLAKINLEAMNNSQKKTQLTKELNEVEQGLKELKDAVKENTAAEEGSSGGSDRGGTGGGTKKDKKKGGGFEIMFALSTAASLAASSLDMLSEKVGGTTTAMGQFTGMLSSTINTVIGVGFAMTAFGLSFAKVGAFLAGFTAVGKAATAATALSTAANETAALAHSRVAAAATIAGISDAQKSLLAEAAAGADANKTFWAEKAAAADAKKVGMGGQMVGGLIGIVVGTALVVMAFRAAANAFIEKQKELKELAIKEGDADKAGEAEEAIIRREEKSTGQTVGGTAAGVAGGVAGGIYLGAGAASKIGAVLGTAIAPGVGTAVGAAIGAVGGALVGVFAGGAIAEGFNESLSPVEQAAVHGARASAFASKATLEMAKSAEKAAERLEDFESGKGDASSLFSDFGGQSVAAAQGIAAERDKRESLKEARSTELDRERNRFQEFVWDYGGEDLDEIDKKLKESKAKEVKIYEEMAKASAKNYQAGQRSAAAAGQTFDQFMETVEKGNPAYADLLKGNVVEHQKRRKAYDKLQKVMEENRKVLQSLTFGLGEFASKAQATAAAMERTADTFGENEFEAAFETLSLAFTKAAISMNAKDIETSITSADDQLEAFGADKKTREKFRGQARGVSFLQSKGKDIFQEAKNKAIADGDGNLGGKEGLEIYKDAAIKEISQSNLGQEAKEALIAQIKSGQADEGIKKALDTGDPDEIADSLSGPLKEQLQKDLEEFGKAASEVQKQLRSAYQMQIKAQNEYTDALRKNIKVQGEVLDLFEEFGGPKVTNQQRVDLLNKDLGAATNRNVGTGSPADLRRIVEDSFNSSANIRQRQQQSLRATGVASSGMTTREMVSSERRLNTDDERQEEVINYARERIDLIREEIRIQKEKNKLEKSSLDALLSGDIEGFFKQQAAVGAQAALKSGNQGLVSNFGATAVGAGFQDLAQQEGVDDATKRRAAGMALNQFGITDQGAADVLAEQTPEIRALNAEAQEFAKVMSEASIALTQMERNELVITAQQVNLIEKKAGRAANLRTGTTNRTENFYRGGPVYANRGMFVPRGTDTVPAMLTPGEFVVNRASVQRGNNLAVLKAMNSNQQASGPAMAQGGQVQYRQFGGIIDAIGKTFESALPNLQNVFSGFTSAVEKLTGMQIGVKLDASTVTVNIASNVLQQLPELIQSHVYKEIVRQLPKIQHSPNGSHKLDDVG